MRSLNSWLFRPIAVCLVLSLIFPAGQVGTAAAQQSVAENRPANAPSQERETAGQPAGRAIVAENALPEAPEPVSQKAEAQGAQNGAPLDDPAQQQTGPAKPVGTAAAPYERTMGVAASRPAGAAIAPAKQRRVRTILISVGVIVGAGVAVGTVAALSHGSANRP